jgi:hypothetical protein
VRARWVCTSSPFDFHHSNSCPGTGIAFVSALRARVPVLLHDRSQTQIDKGLELVDKLLAKDVAKGKIKEIEAKEARDLISVVAPDVGVKGLRDVDMVVEVPSCFLLHPSKLDLVCRQYPSLCRSNYRSSKTSPLRCNRRLSSPATLPQ